MAKDKGKVALQRHLRWAQGGTGERLCEYIHKLTFIKESLRNSIKTHKYLLVTETSSFDIHTPDFF